MEGYDYSSLPPSTRHAPADSSNTDVLGLSIDPSDRLRSRSLHFKRQAHPFEDMLQVSSLTAALPRKGSLEAG
jgi:hypothetical protein